MKSTPPEDTQGKERQSSLEHVCASEDCDSCSINEYDPLFVGKAAREP